MALRTPTTPDNDKKQDELYNPGEQLTQEKMGGGYVDAGTDQLEAFANDPENSSEKLDEKERDGTVPPDTNFNSTYGGKKDRGGKILTGANVRAILKKRGPLGLIGIIGLGGGLFGSLLFSPGIMLVQMKEMLVDRFNYQLAGMETRSNIILNKKISADFTSGICTNPLSVRCKYSTISNKQAERLKLAGIDIEDGSQKIGNRIKPGTIKWNDETISAKDFKSKFNSDPNFRSAMRKAYNPRFAGFADKIWAKVAARIGISKVRALPDGDDATKAKGIQEDVKNGTKLSIPDDNIECPASGNCTSNGEELDEEASKAARAAKEAAKELAEEVIEEADNLAAKSISAAATAPVNAVANFVKVTGAVDIGCQAYTAVRTLGFAAKTVRAVQLARYAMVFLNTADQIKEGTATAEDVAYLGGILTNVAYDAVSGAKRKAAMDSFGMQYASYGTMGGYSNSYISQFMAGGGLTGDLINITDLINTYTGGTPKTTCAVLANGWAQLGSFAAGVALLLIPGANVAFTAADVAKGAISAAASVALLVLPDLLKDIVAGAVTEGLVGEDAGNAIASGTGTMMSSLSQARGGAPLSVDQAVAYTSVQKQVVARYAEEEQATLSPLDPTSRNTFVGSIISQILPYSASLTNTSTTLSSLPQFLGSTLSSIIPKTSALSAEEAKQSFSSCTDYDYQDLKVAADPFCNPLFGIPVEYLNKDPITVADELIASGDITEEGVPQGEYITFIQDCINRDRPIGDTGASADGDDGAKCKVDTVQKANYYLFNLDGTIDDGMDGYAEEGSTGGNESKQELAKKIVAKNKVTYGIYGEDVQPRLEAIADGSVNADDEPCGINLYILKAIDAITDKYSIEITDINRHCTNSLASSPAGRHYAGNGSAIDIDKFNGVQTTGRDANALDVISIIMPILTEAAANAGSYSGLGQAYCGGSASLGANVIEFDDFCHHLHFEVPPTADPTLKYSPGKPL